MSRKRFMEKLGATCNNWRQSWSYINLSERFIVFGAWNDLRSDKGALVFSKTWKSIGGQSRPGYKQSREHIRLIEQEGFGLKIFIMYAENPTNDGSTRRISSFDWEVFDRELVRDGDSWYAIPVDEVFQSADEVFGRDKEYLEGQKKTIVVNAYERNSDARKACLQYHGYKCKVCEFDFQDKYGELGAHYIHVHHKMLISEKEGIHKVDPINDLVPVCPNCHSMIHRGGKNRSLETLREIIIKNRFTPSW